MSTQKHGTKGQLYVVATPIGNRDDLSPRAISLLQQVTLILAEDTRHSGKLLKYAAVSTPLHAFHEHNEQQQVTTIMDKLHQGQDIALISDAGTPLISDPGYRLISAAHDHHINVVPIPGPCALIAALSAAGLSSASFSFYGFLPAKQAARKTALTALVNEVQTLIFYEAPHRIVDMLMDIEAVFGPRRLVSIARELTKQFETIKRGPIAELLDWIKADPNQQRGEFVVLIEGCDTTQKDSVTLTLEAILSPLLAALPLKQAVDLAVKITGVKKNSLYNLALTLNSCID